VRICSASTVLLNAQSPTVRRTLPDLSSMPLMMVLVPAYILLFNSCRMILPPRRRDEARKRMPMLMYAVHDHMMPVLMLVLKALDNM